MPNRGTGIIATRDIQAGEIVLAIPTKLFQSLDHVPATISQSLPGQISLHALLAAHLTLDKPDSFAVPNKSLPDFGSFEANMPFLWPSELHPFFPKPAIHLMTKQQRNFQRDWDMVSKVFSNLTRQQYLHSWVLVNTRSFYYTTPSMEKLPHHDRLALLPVADLFNHADVGCESAFSSSGNYEFTADRQYRAGEELHICYGAHSNDFLLAEYGFVLTENRWDVVCLDEAILPCLNEEQRDILHNRGYLGNYVLDLEAGACFRTQVALQMLCCTQEQWERFVLFETDDEESSSKRVTLLMQLLKSHVQTIQEILEYIGNLGIGQMGQREVLVKRWRQIEDLVVRTMKNLDS